jgi:hypothetical protein
MMIDLDDFWVFDASRDRDPVGTHCYGIWAP